jgi:hypothetical protein
MRVLAFGMVIGVVLLATTPARFVGWACTSGEEETGLDETLCDAVGGTGRTGQFGWWLGVLWPAVVFGLTQLSAGLRRHPLACAIWIALAAVAFWVVVGTITIDV